MKNNKLLNNKLSEYLTDAIENNYYELEEYIKDINYKVEIYSKEIECLKESRSDLLKFKSILENKDNKLLKFHIMKRFNNNDWIIKQLIINPIKITNTKNMKFIKEINFYIDNNIISKLDDFYIKGKDFDEYYEFLKGFGF